MACFIDLGIFLLGAGAGSLASRLLYANQIRKLKRVLEAGAYSNSKTEEQDHQPDRRRSA
jgi:hypothetical protein